MHKIPRGNVLKAVFFSISLKAIEKTVVARPVIKNYSFSLFLGGNTWRLLQKELKIQLFAAAQQHIMTLSRLIHSLEVSGSSVSFCWDGARASVPFSAFLKIYQPLSVTVPFFLWGIILQLLRDMVECTRTYCDSPSFHANKDTNVSAQSFGI